MLISCHIPKTAGTSFFTALQEVYGERFLLDLSHEKIIPAMYAEDSQPHESIPVRWLGRYRAPKLQDISCIHGHFPLRKFLPLAFNRDNIFVVWLREPLQWRISLYYFWKQLYPHPVAKYLNRFFDEGWDLERFCSYPMLDNYQSRYLAWFPWYRINFVGVTEHYESDLHHFSRRVLGRELTLCNLNQGKKPSDLPSDGGFGKTFMRRFESRNRHDYRNYRAARRASDARFVEWEFGDRRQPGNGHERIPLPARKETPSLTG
jgi:hypothetical protein